MQRGTHAPVAVPLQILYLSIHPADFVFIVIAVKCPCNDSLVIVFKGNIYILLCLSIISNLFLNCFSVRFYKARR